MVLFLLPQAVAAAPADTGSVIAVTPHFAFYSDFDTNLNDALVAEGLARSRDRAERFESGDERSCFDGLPSSSRAGWNRAVDYYAEIISPGEWNERPQYLIRMHLAGLREGPGDDRDRAFLEIASGMRAAAAPAYEACRWEQQDARNHRWIDALQKRLAVHEDRIARRLAEVYQAPWSALPFRVDVVETVSWSGANSIFPDSIGGHLLISSSYEGNAALEVVFHEASHQWMLDGKPVPQALDAAASELQVPLPGPLWHILLFYTTGQAVRRSLAEAGEPGYTPLLDAIFDRSKEWSRYRAGVESAWPPYLEGNRTLSEATVDLVRALPQPEGR